jgi:hypothetical protein
MQRKASTRSISIINEAAGGNQVLKDGLGPNALGRIERGVIAQSGVRYMLTYEGVNDHGAAATDPATQSAIANRLISAFT